MKPVSVYEEANKAWKERIAELERGNRDLRKELKAAEAARDAAVARAEAAEGLLREITPSRLIGESHKPYPEGKTTVLMSWDWLRRVRSVEAGRHLPGDAGGSEG